MPMVARSSQFTGEQGGSRFLRHALTYGVSPSDTHARDRSNLCPDLRGGGSEPLFPADEIMRGIVRDRNEDSKVFRAGRANSRRTAVELLEHRLSPNIASWVRRFFKSSKIKAGSNDDADFEGGGDGKETLVLERSERTTFVGADLIQDGSHPTHSSSADQLGSVEFN